MATILHKQIRVPKFKPKLARALAAHDLLLDDPARRKQQRISEKSHLNTYRFRGEIISTENERKEALEYVQSLYENDNKDFDSTTFRKTKYKLKKWIESEKTSEAEKKLYESLIQIVDEKNGKNIDIEKVESRLSKAGESQKISRYNDKLKALKTLCSLHNERNELNIDQTSQLNAATISVLLKIPEHNGEVLTGEEQEKLINHYYEENFPDHEVILSIVHHDESLAHVQLTIDGKNKRTGEYDFVQSQYDYIRKKKSLDFPELNSKLTPGQLQIVGEEIQSDFYEFLNSCQQKAVFAKKEYLDEEHKRLERQKIKLDTSKRIADREYNTANYLAKQKQEIEQNTKKIILNNKFATGESKEIKKLNASLKKKTEELVKDALESAALYAVSVLEQPLKVLAERIKRLYEIHPKIASEVAELAENMQPDDDKKKVIKEVHSKTKIK